MYCSFSKISEKYSEIFHPLPDLQKPHLVKESLLTKQFTKSGFDCISIYCCVVSALLSTKI